MRTAQDFLTGKDRGPLRKRLTRKGRLEKAVVKMMQSPFGSDIKKILAAADEKKHGRPPQGRRNE